jgi:hypothetical protein
MQRDFIALMAAEAAAARKADSSSGTASPRAGGGGSSTMRSRSRSPQGVPSLALQVVMRGSERDEAALAAAAARNEARRVAASERREAALAERQANALTQVRFIADTLFKQQHTCITHLQVREAETAARRKQAKLWMATACLISRHLHLLRAVRTHRAAAFGAQITASLLPLKRKVFTAWKAHHRCVCIT